MTDLQRQAKDAAEILLRSDEQVTIQNWDKSVEYAVEILRRIERGELVEVVYCEECYYRKICKGMDGRTPYNGEYCSYGRRLDANP